MTIQTLTVAPLSSAKLPKCLSPTTVYGYPIPLMLSEGNVSTENETSSSNDNDFNNDNDNDNVIDLYTLPSSVVLFPFHSLSASNPGHLVWDDFLPMYTLLNIFGMMDVDTDTNVDRVDANAKKDNNNHDNSNNNDDDVLEIRSTFENTPGFCTP
mmetsp:Transcript_13016/g.26604  ORF Transcript_13016/g.26604 Transcript_13016/m.26604 type:complete len:155 (-) Transcript_13016:103-567(-)